MAEAHGARLLDLKQASESLVVSYRQRVLQALAVAATQRRGLAGAYPPERVARALRALWDRAGD